MSGNYKALGVGAAALFSASAYFNYRYVSAHRLVTASPDADGPAPGCAFDRLADRYDEAVGQEEGAMWYGMMRSWLLTHAEGDVLEVSAGTGRNFPYVPYTKIKSLTVADVSQEMLRRAEDKYFDQLRLGYKHPEVRITFCVADAHCLVEPTTRAAAAGPAGGDAAALAAGDSGKNSRWSWWGRQPKPGAGGDQQADPGKGPRAQGPSPPGPADASPSPAAAAEAVHAQRRLPELAGSGSLLNIFRVLMPPSQPAPQDPPPGPAASDAPGQAPGSGTIPAGHPSPVSSAGAADARPHRAVGEAGCCGGHDVEPGAWSERCASGCLASGTRLQRFRPHQFDTVVDTFGLCSCEDPVQALREMARVCKPGGKILLLEHGRSHYSWLNRTLDEGAVRHHKTWGCMWNRSILDLVRKAGLHVDKVTRWHLGTSYWIVARPPPLPA